MEKWGKGSRNKKEDRGKKKREERGERAWREGMFYREEIHV